MKKEFQEEQSKLCSAEKLHERLLALLLKKTAEYLLKQDDIKQDDKEFLITEFERIYDKDKKEEWPTRIREYFIKLTKEITIDDFVDIKQNNDDTN